MTGDELRRLREERGLSQRRLSSLLGVGVATINAWERREQLTKSASALIREFASRTDARHVNREPQPVRESLSTDGIEAEIERQIRQNVVHEINNNPWTHHSDVTNPDELHAWLKSEAKRIDWLAGIFIPPDEDELEKLLDVKQRAHFQAMGEEIYVSTLFERPSPLLEGKLSPSIEEKHSLDLKIKVIGIGGGGSNAVAHMATSGLRGVEFIATDTDVRASYETLGFGPRDHRFHMIRYLPIGHLTTKGLGTEAKPEIGREAALEVRDRIVKKALADSAMVFIVAGMGGGTGTGVAPVVAQLAKDLGILTVAAVTKPFPFEGRRRLKVALKGLEELSQHCDLVITIPTEKLVALLGRDTTMAQAFQACNHALQSAVQGITDLIASPGHVSIDFTDIRTVIRDMGEAEVGIGRGRGDDRSTIAAKEAIRDPMLRDNSTAASRVLVNITAGEDLTVQDYCDVGHVIDEIVSEETSVNMATSFDPRMRGEVRVTIIRSTDGKGDDASPVESDASSQEFLDLPAFLQRET